MSHSESFTNAQTQGKHLIGPAKHCPQETWLFQTHEGGWLLDRTGTSPWLPLLPLLTVLQGAFHLQTGFELLQEGRAGVHLSETLDNYVRATVLSSGFWQLCDHDKSPTSLSLGVLIHEMGLHHTSFLGLF